MFSRLRDRIHRPSPAMIVALIALFVALGGSSYAAIRLSKNAVKGRHIAKNAVTSPKVKDQSLLAHDFASGQLPKGDKGDSGQDATAPTGAVMFFNLNSCPPGWSELTGARGRYLVARPAGGSVGTAVGTALTSSENRAVGQHGHGITDPEHSHRTSIPNDDASGDNTGTYRAGVTAFSFVAHQSTSDPTGITVNAAGDVAGTNAPYLQLLACQKG